MTQEDERAILIAENARQREQMAELVAQNGALAARIQEQEACTLWRTSARHRRLAG
jgi:hypothetical protein